MKSLDFNMSKLLTIASGSNTRNMERHRFWANNSWVHL